MYIISARMVDGPNGRRTAIAGLVPDGTPWDDLVEADGQTVITTIPVRLPDEVITAIGASTDVYDMLDLTVPEDEIHVPDTRRRRKIAHPVRSLDAPQIQAARLFVGKIDLPDTAVGDTADTSDVLGTVREAVLWRQIMRDTAPSTRGEWVGLAERMPEAATAVAEAFAENPAAGASGKIARGRIIAAIMRARRGE